LSKSDDSENFNSYGPSDSESIIEVISEKSNYRRHDEHTTQDQDERNKLIDALLNHIHTHIKEFSDDTVVDSKDDNLNLKSTKGKGAKEAQSGYKNRSSKAPQNVNIEHELNMAFNHSFVPEVKQSFPSRLPIYNSCSSSLLEKEEEYTHNIINSYLKLNDLDDTTNELDKFNDLTMVTDQFMSYIQKEELNSNKINNLQFEPLRRQEKQLTNKIYNGNTLENMPVCTFTDILSIY
jgi:hypothetical protein